MLFRATLATPRIIETALRTALPKVVGPLFTAVLLVVVHVAKDRGLPVGGATVLLVGGVICSVLLGGAKSGITSAALALLFVAETLSAPGAPFHYTAANGLRVLVFTLVAGATVGVLSRFRSSLRVVNLESQRKSDVLVLERAARATAEASAKVRSEVLAVVSHDLRNPLGSILGAVALLEKFLPDDRGRPQIAVIRRSAGRMAMLIGDLLDESLLEAGRLRVRAGPTEPAALVLDACTAFEASATEHHVTLQREINPGVALVLADADRISQVLSNLLANALKFTPAGGIISVRAAPCGDAVRFFVSDSGAGIQPADLERVFEPFWQGRPKEGRGVGLGLAIAKGIVEAHGGAIAIDSSLGSGTCVSFTLPSVNDPRG